MKNIFGKLGNRRFPEGPVKRTLNFILIEEGPHNFSWPTCRGGLRTIPPPPPKKRTVYNARFTSFKIFLDKKNRNFKDFHLNFLL